MAPIDKPRIIVAVMVDEPSAGKYFGGDVAAPVFSEVVQQTLRMMGVQPDLDVKPQIVAHESGRGGELLMAAAPARIARRRRALAALRAARGALHDRQPRGAARATASSPGPAHATDGRALRAAALAQGARACLVEAEGVEAFGFDGDARRRATPA